MYTAAKTPIRDSESTGGIHDGCDSATAVAGHNVSIFVTPDQSGSADFPSAAKIADESVDHAVATATVTQKCRDQASLTDFPRDGGDSVPLRAGSSSYDALRTQILRKQAVNAFSFSDNVHLRHVIRALLNSGQLTRQTATNIKAQHPEHAKRFYEQHIAHIEQQLHRKCVLSVEKPSQYCHDLVGLLSMLPLIPGLLIEEPKLLFAEHSKGLLTEEPKLFPAEHSKGLLAEDAKLLSAENSKELLAADNRASFAEDAKPLSAENSKGLLTEDNRASFAKAPKGLFAANCRSYEDTLHEDTKQPSHQDAKGPFRQDAESFIRQYAETVFHQDGGAVQQEPVHIILDGGRKTRNYVLTLQFVYQGLYSLIGTSAWQLSMEASLCLAAQFPHGGRDWVFLCASDYCLIPEIITLGGGSSGATGETRAESAETGAETAETWTESDETRSKSAETRDESTEHIHQKKLSKMLSQLDSKVDMVLFTAPLPADVNALLHHCAEPLLNLCEDFQEIHLQQGATPSSSSSMNELLSEWCHNDCSRIHLIKHLQRLTFKGVCVADNITGQLIAFREKPDLVTLLRMSRQGQLLENVMYTVMTKQLTRELYAAFDDLPCHSYPAAASTAVPAAAGAVDKGETEHADKETTEFYEKATPPETAQQPKHMSLRHMIPFGFYATLFASRYMSADEWSASWLSSRPAAVPIPQWLHDGATLREASMKLMQSKHVLVASFGDNCIVGDLGTPMAYLTAVGDLAFHRYGRQMSGLDPIGCNVVQSQLSHDVRIAVTRPQQLLMHQCVVTGSGGTLRILNQHERVVLSHCVIRCSEGVTITIGSSDSDTAESDTVVHSDQEDDPRVIYLYNCVLTKSLCVRGSNLLIGYDDSAEIQLVDVDNSAVEVSKVERCASKSMPTLQGRVVTTLSTDKSAIAAVSAEQSEFTAVRVSAEKSEFMPSSVTNRVSYSAPLVLRDLKAQLNARVFSGQEFSTASSNVNFSLLQQQRSDMATLLQKLLVTPTCSFSRFNAVSDGIQPHPLRVQHSDASEAEVVQQIRAVFGRLFGVGPQCIVAAPGRINAGAAHTDWSYLHVLGFAIDRQTYVSISIQPQLHSVLIYSDMMSCGAVVPLPDAASVRLPKQEQHELQWLNYVVGILDELRARRLNVPGMFMYITGNLPMGTGLSSSAAIENAVCYAVLKATGQSLLSIPQSEAVEREKGATESATVEPESAVIIPRGGPTENSALGAEIAVIQPERATEITALAELERATTAAATVLHSSTTSMNSAAFPQHSDASASPEDLAEKLRVAQLAHLVENRYVGVGCGFLDQGISAAGALQQYVLFRCDKSGPVLLQTLQSPMQDQGYCVCVIDTGTSRELASHTPEDCCFVHEEHMTQFNRRVLRYWLGVCLLTHLPCYEGSPLTVESEANPALQATPQQLLSVRNQLFKSIIVVQISTSSSPASSRDHIQHSLRALLAPVLQQTVSDLSQSVPIVALLPANAVADVRSRCVFIGTVALNAVSVAHETLQCHSTVTRSYGSGGSDQVGIASGADETLQCHDTVTAASQGHSTVTASPHGHSTVTAAPQRHSSDQVDITSVEVTTVEVLVDMVQFHVNENDRVVLIAQLLSGQLVQMLHRQYHLAEVMLTHVNWLREDKQSLHRRADVEVYIVELLRQGKAELLTPLQIAVIQGSLGDLSWEDKRLLFRGDSALQTLQRAYDLAACVTRNAVSAVSHYSDTFSNISAREINAELSATVSISSISARETSDAAVTTESHHSDTNSNISEREIAAELTVLGKICPGAGWGGMAPVYIRQSAVAALQKVVTEHNEAVTVSGSDNAVTGKTAISLWCTVPSAGLRLLYQE
eukprot:TRINITY_DN1970_c0_g1_i1.p1 TRINITY_DN1970_c0_g1~~TRINITY_DN1970_c0_g1_i1.p1  ORF type:complete len:1846 (-),score=391.18 TRINITY_DN1970_c0_g1_i1:42-5579(-)